jgi:hypothetical protein
MSVFSERTPIPQMIEYEVDAPSHEGAQLAFSEGAAKPTYTETRRGVVRHVTHSMYMDLDTARRVQQWLADRITQLEAGE